MVQPDLTERIRDIFLQHSPRVSIASAARLLGVPVTLLRESVKRGEMVAHETVMGLWVDREELVVQALLQWSLDVVEEALADDAPLVLPWAIRLVPLHARVPRHQMQMLEYFAARDCTTISGALTHELDGIATANVDELSAALPGFRAALDWFDAPLVPLSEEN